MGALLYSLRTKITRVFHGRLPTKHLTLQSLATRWNRVITSIALVVIVLLALMEPRPLLCFVLYESRLGVASKLQTRLALLVSRLHCMNQHPCSQKHGHQL